MHLPNAQPPSRSPIDAEHAAGDRRSDDRVPGGQRRAVDHSAGTGRETDLAEADRFTDGDAEDFRHPVGGPRVTRLPRLPLSAERQLGPVRDLARDDHPGCIDTALEGCHGWGDIQHSGVDHTRSIR